MTYSKILTELLILAIYIVIGLIIKKLRIINEEGIGDISKIVVNVAMPLTVISSMNIGYKDEYVKNMLYIFIFSIIYLAFTALASKRISKFFAHDIDKQNAQRYSMIFGNAVFLGYPLCYALFGQIGMFYASVFVAAQNIFQWTLGVHIYKNEKFSILSLKKLLNPGLVAICIGMIMFFLKIRTPELMSRVISGLGGISVPLALIVIGATLTEFKLKEVLSDVGVHLVTFFKTIAFPGIFLAALYFIPIDKTLKSILVIQAAAPVQASGVVFAKNFNGDHGTVSKCVAFTTAVCAISIPIFLVIINK